MVALSVSIGNKLEKQKTQRSCDLNTVRLLHCILSEATWQIYKIIKFRKYAPGSTLTELCCFVRKGIQY